jgi:BirA family transcriptional regulator, biotin operon repressor / biotin---[acetyl-CoA-carboxylase] ligase
MSDWPFVRSWVHREVAGSTNQVASDLLSNEDLSLPLLVTAAQQTAGRGRGKHQWWSDSGSLTATIAIDRDDSGLRAADESRVSLATAVAVIDALEIMLPGVPFRIRWPNDVEVNDRKLGGLLPERLITPCGPRVMVGIGLNVSTRLEDAPPDVRRMAVSLSELSVRSSVASFDRFDVLRAILARLGRSLRHLADDDASLVARWNELDALADRVVRIDQGGKVIAGVACGIDASGALRLACGEKTVLIRGGQVLREPRTPM